MIQNCHELNHVKLFNIQVDSHLSIGLRPFNFVIQFVNAQSIMVKLKEWVFVILILMSESIHSLERSRRFFIYPKTAPTRVQVNEFVIYSISIPESIFVLE